jgi:TonB family protein
MTNFTKAIAPAALLLALAASVPAAAETRITSACPTRDADAVMTSTIPADLPPFAKIAGLSGKSIIQFDLDAHGNAHNAAIYASSGSPSLDAAARQVALQETYSPEVHNCQGVSGTYRVVVVFDRSDGR